MRSAEEGSTTALCQFEPYKPFVIAVAQGEKPAQNWKIAANLEKKPIGTAIWPGQPSQSIEHAMPINYAVHAYTSYIHARRCTVINISIIEMLQIV